MSEETQNQAVETENQEQVDTQEEEVKTVPLTELQRRLSVADEKHQKELDELRETTKKQIEEAVAKAKMTDSELKSLQKKEQEQKYLDAQHEIEELKKQIALGQLKDKATTELSNRNIPVTDKHLALVMRGEEEETLSAIEMLSDLLTQQKRESSVTQPPLTSGGKQSNTSTDIFKIMDSAAR